MANIFISYRREDSDIWVSRLVDELSKHFPPSQLFQDVASIDPGADFVESLDKALGTAAVMLAVLGPSWLSASDKQGRRRLDFPSDFVRQEIAESLRRPGVRVFPLLVNGAQMPAEEDLPEPLKPLSRRQAFELTVRHWHPDVAELVQVLKQVGGFSGDRGEAEADPRGTAEHEAQRRETDARAAREAAERLAAEEQAHRKSAEEQAKRKTEDRERRRAEVRAQQKAAQQARQKSEEEAQRTVRCGSCGASVFASFGSCDICGKKLDEELASPASPAIPPARTVRCRSCGASVFASLSSCDICGKPMA